PQGGDPESALRVQEWEPLEQVFPGLTGDAPILQTVELSRGSATKAALDVVHSALTTYRTSVKFYGDMRDQVPMVANQIHQPSQDETVALLVTDRHDNIGMDPVAAAVGDAGDASIVIDMGDDTSTGGSWEAFSLNS